MHRRRLSTFHPGPHRFATPRVAVFLVFGILLTACEDRGGTVERQLGDYLVQVRYAAGAAGLELPASPPTAPSWPRQRDIRLDLPDTRMGFLDFFALQDCALHRIIAERNNAMGRVMTPSQRLVYEQRFIAAARECRALLLGTGETGLANRVDSVLRIKEETLSRVFWNATFGGPEFAALFSGAAQPLPWRDNAGSIDRELTALTLLATLQESLADGRMAVEAHRVEAAFELLDESRFGGALVRSLDLITHHLNAAADVVELRLDQGPLCGEEGRSPDAEALIRAFYRGYGGGVQPYLARVHRLGREWLALVDRLVSGQDSAVAPAFRSWYRERLDPHHPESAWNRFQEAVARHTATWGRLLEQCDALPGMSGTPGGNAPQKPQP